WASDALLCQIYGDKDFVMYDPSQAAYLSKDGKAIDIEKPDFEMFPDFPRARASMRDTLRPGEILFVPAGWHHHFKSATDSISLTWNFVHLARLAPYLAYLAGGPAEGELKQLAYAYFDSPGHRPMDGSSFVGSLSTQRILEP
ncbi:MAG TPA: cupin-like domain-containing protein, partial [Acidisarcina sp.]